MDFSTLELSWCQGSVTYIKLLPSQITLHTSRWLKEGKEGLFFCIMTDMMPQTHLKKDGCIWCCPQSRDGNVNLVSHLAGKESLKRCHLSMVVLRGLRAFPSQLRVHCEAAGWPLLGCSLWYHLRGGTAPPCCAPWASSLHHLSVSRYWHCCRGLPSAILPSCPGGGLPMDRTDRGKGHRGPCRLHR